jgi:YVTN family beta-propeller protein
MRMLRRPALAVMLLVTFWPTVVLGQGVRAGVVTTLEGSASAARAAVPQPVALKFKDDVFLQDRITTGDRSLARLLLGGRALVTVRERSSLTIAEVPGRTDVGLDAGKIAVAVARDRMRPGESIGIRTPNAVAGVRGTVVVAEVSRATAQIGGGGGIVTTFYVIRDQSGQGVDVQQLNPLTGQPVGPPVRLGPLESLRMAGAAPGQKAQISPQELGQILAGLEPTNVQSPEQARAANQNQINEQQMQQAVLLTNTLLGDPSLLLPPSLDQVGLDQETTACGGVDCVSSTTSGTTDPGLVIPPPIDTSPIALTGSASYTGRGFVASDGTPINVAGDLITVDSAQALTSGSLLTVQQTEISAGGAILGIAPGVTLDSTSTSPVLFLDPTPITANHVVRVADGATLNVVSTLVKAIDISFSGVGNGLLTVNPLATLTQTAAEHLIVLQNSTVNGTLVRVNGGTLTVNGGAILGTLGGAVVITGALLNFIGGSAGVANLLEPTVFLNGVPVFFAPGVNATVSIGSDALLGAGTLTVVGSLVSVEADGTVAIGNQTGAASFTQQGGELLISGPFTISQPISDRIAAGTPLRLDGAQVSAPGTLLTVPAGTTVDRGTVVVHATNNSTLTVGGGGNVLTVDGTLTTSTTDALLGFDTSIVNAADLVSVSGSLAHDGVLVGATDATFNLTGNVLTVTGDLTGGPNTLLGFDPTTVNAANVVLVGTGGTLTLSETLLGDLDGTFTLSGRVLSVAGGGTLAAAGVAGSVIVLEGTTVNAVDVVTIAGSATVGGRLLDVVNGSLNPSGNVLTVAGSLTGGSDTLLRMDSTPPTGSTIVTAANVVSVAGSLTLSSALLTDVGGGYSLTGGLLSVAGSLDASGTAETLIQLDGTTVVAGGNAVNVAGFLEAGGGLVSLSNGTLSAAHLVSVNGAITTGRAVDTVNSTLTLTGNVLNVAGLMTGGAGTLVALATTSVSAVDVVAVPGSLTVGGQLLHVPDGDLSLSGNVLTVTGSVTGGTDTLIAIDPTTVSAAGVVAIPGGAVTLSEALLSDVSGLYTLAGSLLAVTAGGTLDATASSSPLVNLFDSTVTSTGSNLFTMAGTGSTFQTAGTLLSATGVTLAANNHLLRLADGATVSGTSTSPFIDITDTTFTGGTGGASTGGAILRMVSQQGADPTSLTLAGGLLRAAGVFVLDSQNGGILEILDSATVTATGSAPFLEFFGSAGASAASAFTFIAIGPPGALNPVPGTDVPPVVSLGGSLLAASGVATFATADANGRPFLAIFDGAAVTKTGADPLLDLAGTAPGDVVVDAAGNVVFVGTTAAARPLPSLALSGPLVQAFNARLDSGNPGGQPRSTVFIGDGATATKTDGTALLVLDSTTVNSSGGLVVVRRSPLGGPASTLSLGAGTLLSAFSSTISTVNSSAPGGSSCCDGFFIGQGAVLSAGSGSSALIDLVQSTFTAGTSGVGGGSLFGIHDTCSACLVTDTFNLTTAPAVVTIGRPLLHADASDLTAMFHVLLVARSDLSVTGPGAEPVIELVNGSTVLAGLLDPATTLTATGRLLTVVSSAVANTSDFAATVLLERPLLGASASSITTSSDTIGVFNGATLTGTTTEPLLALDTTSLQAGAGTQIGSLLAVGGLGGPTGLTAASVTLEGPLLFATGGQPLTLATGVLRLFNGGQVTVSTAGAAQKALVVLDGVPATLSDVFQGGVLSIGSSGVASSALTTDGPLLEAFNGASVTTLVGPLVGVGGGSDFTSTATDPALSFSAGATLSASAGTASPLLHVFGVGGPGGTTPASATLGGPLLSLTDSSAGTVGGDVILVEQGALLTGTGSDPFITLDASSLGMGRSLLTVRDAGSAVTLAGSLLDARNPTAVLGSGPFLSFVSIGPGGSLTTAGTLSPLVRLENLTLGVDESFLAVTGVPTPASVTLSGPLLEAFDSGTQTVVSTVGRFVSITGATVTQTGGEPFIHLGGSAADMVRIATGGNLLFASAAGGSRNSLTLEGPFLRARNARVETDVIGAISGVNINDGAIVAVNASGPSPFFDLDTVTLAATGALVNVRLSAGVAERSTLDLGPDSRLMFAVNSTLTTSDLGFATVFVGQGGQLTAQTSEALIYLFNSTVNSGNGAFVHVDDICGGCGGAAVALASSVTLAGGLLQTDDSSVTSAFDALFVRRSSVSASGPLFDITNGASNQTFTFGTPATYGALLRVTSEAGGAGGVGSVALGAPLLVTSSGIGFRTGFQVSGDLVGVLDGGILTGSDLAPLIISNDTDYTVGRHFLAVAGAGASSATLAGGFLSSFTDTFAMTGVSPAAATITAPPTVRASVGVGSAGAFPVGLAVTPDGSRVYVGNGGRDGADNTLSVINTATNTVVGSVSIPTELPVGIAFTPDGTRGYVTTAFSNVFVVDTDPGSPTFNQVQTSVLGFAFARFPVVTPDGTRVYVTDQSADVVRVIQTSDNTIVANIPVGTSPFGIAVRADGQRIYVANRGLSGSINGTVSVIDSNPASPTFNTVVATVTIGLDTRPAGIVVTPDGSKVYVANDLVDTVSVISTATNTIVGTIPVAPGPRGIAVTPDGSKVVVASRNFGGALQSSVTVIDTATDTVMATVNLDTAAFAAFVTIHPDGRRVYVSEERAANVAVLDLATGTAFVAIGAGGSVSATGPDPFIDLADSTLTADHLLLLQGTLTLSQPLLRATNATLNLGKSLVRVLGGATLVSQPDLVNGPYPLVLIDGGTVTVGTSDLAGSLMDLAGRATATAADPDVDPIFGGATGLVMGTDQPVQHNGGGALIEVTNGAVVEVEGPGGPVFDPSARRVGNVVTLDTALLAASAPLLRITNQAFVESYGNVIDLAFRSRVNFSGTDLIRIEQSQLDIVKGHLAAVAGGSRLNITGNLLTMVGNGTPSTLNLFDGALLFVKDGSVVNITGSLVSFSGTSAASNVINVTNTFVPNQFINGVPVFVTGSTIPVIQGNPLANLGTQGTININGVSLPPGAVGGVTGSLIVVQTGGSVKVGNTP